MPPKSPDRDPGQLQLPDEDMGGKQPKVEEESVAAPEPLDIPESPEEEKLLDDNIDAGSAFRMAENSTLKDPFSESDRPEEISLVDLLGREFEGTWHGLYKTAKGRDKLGKVAYILMHRFSGPAQIRLLADGFEKLYVKEMQEEIDKLHDETHDIRETRYDRAAAYRVKDLGNRVDDLTAILCTRKLTGREIFVYLNTLADDWDKKIAKEG